MSGLKSKITILGGPRLIAFDESWYSQIETVTSLEPYLLPKTRAELELAAREERLLVAIDAAQDSRVVGGIGLWELDRDDMGVMWHKLETFFVMPEYRFRKTGLPIADRLFTRLLDENREKNIVCTTGNIRAIRTGARNGMQPIRCRDLPGKIRLSSCVCSGDALIGNNRASCLVSVSGDTWLRLGEPPRLHWPAKEIIWVG